MTRSRRNTQDCDSGITIIELTASMSVLVIGFFSLAGALGLGFRTVAFARQKQSAASIATGRIEHLRNLPYEGVALDAAITQSGDSTSPDYYVSVDGNTYDVSGDGDFEELIVDTTNGGIIHFEDPVVVGESEFRIYQYATWVDDADIAGTQDYKRVTVITEFKSPTVQGVSRMVRQYTYFSDEAVTGIGSGTGTTTTSPFGTTTTTAPATTTTASTTTTTIAGTTTTAAPVYVALASDTFNRPNSAVSMGSTNGAGTADPAAWNTFAGTWGISTNRAYIAAATTSFSYINTAHSDIAAKVTVTKGSSGGQGLIFRANDVNNYWRLYWNTFNSLTLDKRVSGINTTMGTWSVAGTSALLGIEAQGDYIKVFANDVQLASYHDASLQFNTQHGMYSSVVTGFFLDNWQLWRVVTPCVADITAPTGDYSIGTTPGATAGYSATTSLSIQMMFSDTCPTLIANFSNDGVTYGADVAVISGVVSSVGWTVSPDNGTKSVSGKIRDGLGNVRFIAAKTVVLDTTLPTTPGTLTRTTTYCSGNNRTVVLNWGLSTDTNLVGYRVYRSINSAAFTMVASTTSLSFANTHPKSSDSTQFYVKAYDAAGNESVATNTISIAKNICT